MLPENLKQSCWITIENQSNKTILVRKYKRIDFFSEQRIFHPEETGIMTEGIQWNKNFIVKIFFFSPDKNRKTKRIMKLKVNKIYKIIIHPNGFSCKTIKEEQIDKKLCAYQRMEEIWENSDYYETLRINKNATQREIRISYLKLAREYHPDHNSNPNARLMFERIVEAYNTLSDEEIKRKYDTHLRTDSGVLSKSYWRQIFCIWNKHKAIQVGISTLLTITGSVLLLTSLLAIPSGIGLPASLVSGAIGGGLFASGIGGLSVALSRSAALEDHKLYSRWLKYSFWYGIAGASLGAFSAGIGSAIGTTVGGMAGVMALASIKGAASGVCFSTAHGIASDKWIQMIKKLRIDTIALDLLIGTITGAALGIIFESALMTSKVASALATQAKISSKTFLKSSPETHKEENSKTQKLLFLEYNQAKDQTNKFSSKLFENENTHKSQENCFQNLDLILENCFFLSDEKKSDYDYLPYEPSIVNDFEYNENYIYNQRMEKTLDHSINQIHDFNEVEDYLQCEDSSIESINEAIQLYEMVVVQPTVQIIIYHNLSSIYKVRISIEFIVFENDDVKLIKESPPPDEIFRIPCHAKQIQISFEYSNFGLHWKPVCHSPNVTHVFNFKKPVSRRYFLNACSGVVQVEQVRDEFEQCKYIPISI